MSFDTVEVTLSCGAAATERWMYVVGCLRAALMFILYFCEFIIEIHLLFIGLPIHLYCGWIEKTSKYKKGVICFVVLGSGIQNNLKGRHFELSKVFLVVVVVFFPFLPSQNKFSNNMNSVSSSSAHACPVLLLLLVVVVSCFRCLHAKNYTTEAAAAAINPLDDEKEYLRT